VLDIAEPACDRASFARTKHFGRRQRENRDTSESPCVLRADSRPDARGHVFDDRHRELLGVGRTAGRQAELVYKDQRMARTGY
jgi:hypothetical protein